MRLLTFLLLIFLAPAGLIAQNWLDLKKQKAPFHEIQEAFELEWEGKEPTKGSGYKQFKRWEAFVEPRISDDIEWYEISEKYAEGVASIEHVKRSVGAKSAANWESIGLDEWNNSSYAPGNGRVTSIAVNPSNPDIIYIGTPAGGLWKTIDDGDSWTPLTDHFVPLGVGGVAVDQNNPEIVYIGTGDGDGNTTYGLGVFKSLDGGATWSTTSLNFTLNQEMTTNKMICHPTESGVVFAATSEGLWKTTTGGLVWYLVQTGNIRDVEFKPGDPSIVYCCRDRFFKSTDGGDNFSPISEGLPPTSQVERLTLAVSADNSNYVYVLAANDTNYGLLGVYRSTDSGETFELRADSPNILGSSEDGSSTGGQGWYDLALAANPDDADQIFVGGINFWISDNGGSSWDLGAYWVIGGGTYVHADIHVLDYFGSRLFCCSDGGLFRSNTDGNTFSDYSPGLSISQCYRIGVDPQNSERVLCGLQDNGTNLRDNNGDWTHVQGADGMECFFHPTNSNIMYASSQYGGLYVSYDGGDDFDWAAGGIDDNGAWTTPFNLSQSNPDRMFAGYQNVWRSNNGGDTWSQVSTDINQTLRSLEISEADDNYVYVSSYNTIFRTTDGGNNWENIDSGLPNNVNIARIEIDQNDPEHIWVCLSEFNAEEKVYESTNAGDDWVNITGGLPNLPINCIIHDQNNNGILYVGTDYGVWVRHPELADWQLYNDNLPNVIVNDLRIHEEDEKLFAGTYGRSVWRSDLFEMPTTPPIASFTSGSNYICAGQTIEFFDTSVDNFPVWNWSFEGGSPATSTDQNPVITYDTPGTYQVSLTVSNGAGDDSETIDLFVTVYEDGGITAPYQEGFEGIESLDPADWQLTNTSDGAIGWEVNTSAGYTGEHCIWMNNIELDAIHEYEISSETIDLSIYPDTANVIFTFKWAFAQLHEDNDDRLRLYFSEDCGATWSLKGIWGGDGDLPSVLPQLEPFVPSEINQWKADVIDLSADELVSTFRYKFRFTNDNGNNFYLDDINIESFIVGVDEDETIGVSIHPNPTAQNLILEIESPREGNADITIHNTMGQSVRQFTIPSMNNAIMSTLDVSDLTAGTYVLKVKIGEEIITKTFIKR